MWGWLKRNRKTAQEADPLAAFDAVIEALERQGSEVRRSAATLLALRRELTREVDRYQQRITELERRREEGSGDGRAERTLTRDLEEARELHRTSREALEKNQGDAALLVEAAEEVRSKIAELKQERQRAKVRLSAALQVSAALRARMEEFDRVLALDAARDQIERAKALADLYREDHRRRSPEKEATKR